LSSFENLLVGGIDTGFIEMGVDVTDCLQVSVFEVLVPVESSSIDNCDCLVCVFSRSIYHSSLNFY
jgi:hypothetical protein